MNSEDRLIAVLFASVAVVLCFVSSCAKRTEAVNAQARVENCKSVMAGGVPEAKLLAAQPSGVCR